MKKGKVMTELKNNLEGTVKKKNGEGRATGYRRLVSWGMLLSLMEGAERFKTFCTDCI